MYVICYGNEIFLGTYRNQGETFAAFDKVSLSDERIKKWKSSKCAFNALQKIIKTCVGYDELKSYLEIKAFEYCITNPSNVWLRNLREKERKW